MKEDGRRSEAMHQPGRVPLFGPLAGVHWVVCALALVAVGLLLIGLIFDNSFSPILFGTLFGGILVALWLHRHDQSLVATQRASTRPSRETWKPEPQHLVPFGPYGGGQMTSHSIGLVIVVGLLLMGLVATPELSLLVLASAAGGALIGFVLWLRHR